MNYIQHFIPCAKRTKHMSINRDLIDLFNMKHEGHILDQVLTTTHLTRKHVKQIAVTEPTCTC